MEAQNSLNESILVSEFLATEQPATTITKTEEPETLFVPEITTDQHMPLAMLSGSDPSKEFLKQFIAKDGLIYQDYECTKN